MPATTVVVILLTVVAISTFGRYGRPGPRSRAAHACARKIDLALDDRTELAVAARLALRERVGAVGALVGCWIVAGWLYLGTDVLDRSPYLPMVVVLGFFGGHAAGYGGVAWYESTRPVSSGAARIARASTPTHGDYVARHERYGAWVVAGGSVLLGLVVVVVDRTGQVDLDALPWSLVTLSIVGPPVTVVVYELLAGRLLRQRQVATTQLELAWDDALRARTLRDMVTVSLVVGCYAPLALIGTVGDQLEGGWPANPAVGVAAALFPLVTVGLVAMATISYALNPARHFRRRLWPTASAGVVAADGAGQPARWQAGR
ncbi:hypothetical protein [Cellulomonas sp. KRMCY2]|uniref:hypothetical protein n=1 Tax=Cellulomonas sp. KRMCY2 TaxID=1304865 RepID=UPI00045EC16F|nr:hypothetical protein [Cellulomonas sp. KRMCY2]